MGIEEFLLQRAEKKGMEKSKIVFVKSLLASTDFSDERIASIADVTVEFVQKVKALPE